MSKNSEIESSIRALETQRGALGDATVDTAIAALRDKLDKPVSASPARGERRLVTIVFADVSGFTRLSESRDPEEVRDLITAAFDVLVPVIERYGGIVDKFIGDAVMALFGAKVAREDDARRALLAALDMRTAFDAFVASSGLKVGVHFGINSGMVVTGSVGGSGGGAFSVMGDAVNLAARLEDLSEIGEILVGPTTHELGGEGFAFDARAPVQIKGKRDPVPVFALLGRHDLATPGRLQAPLIGRERESAAIAAALVRAQAGEAASICVMGEAGTGKSRLVSEARKRSSESVRWIQVRSVSHDQAIGFGALRTLVHAVSELAPDARPERRVQAVQQRIATRFAQEDRDDAFAQLAMLAGFEGRSAARAEGVADHLVEQRMAATLRQWLEPLEGETPLAVVWEDLHWADRSSLRVLGQLSVDQWPRSCLQILCFRPLKELRAAVANSGAEIIELEPLSREQSTELIDSLVKSARLGKDVIAAILARAEGNPFFLEEIIQSLVSSGAIALADGQGVATASIEAGAIPTTLQGVLMARLDQLNPSEKQVLQTASVIGRIFEPQLLNGLLVGEEQLRAGLEALLETLEGLDLVRPNAASDVNYGTYKFKHALTQEVAYQSVLIATRRKLHRVTANLLSSAAELNKDEGAPLIAYHFENSDQPALAVPFLKIAAQGSARNHASREAVAYYRRIVALAPALATKPDCGASELAHAYDAMGDLLHVAGRSAQALECLNKALALVSEEYRVHRASLLRRSGLSWMTSRNAARAIEFYMQAEAQLDCEANRQAEWWSEWIELRIDLVWAKSWLGENREAFQLLHSSGADIEQRGTLGQRARYRDRMIIARLFKEAAHPSDEAIAAGREALTMAQSWGDLRGIGMAHFTLGYGLTFQRSVVEAQVELGESLRIFLHIGDAEYEVASRAVMGIAARMGGDIGAVEGGVDLTIESARAAGMNSYIAMGLANRAWAALRRGQVSEARAAALEAAEIWTREPWRILWLAHFPLMALALDEGDVAAAKFHAKTILAPIQYDLGSEITTTLREGCEWANVGEHERAMALFKQARRPALDLGFI